MTWQNDRITTIPAPEPTDYDRQYSFTDFEALHPTSPKPASGLEAEFNAIQRALDETQARARLIQRSDGALANESVGVDQLKPDVQIGVNPPTAWLAFTSYGVRDSVVFNNEAWYVCLVSHTSGADFATDLAAEKWQLIFDFDDLLTAEVQLIADEAADSAAAAAASAATLNLPTLESGDQGKLLVVNPTYDGYDKDVVIATAATANTVAKRDASGRMKAADPAAADDVATKDYVDSAADIRPQWTSATLIGTGFSIPSMGFIDVAALNETDIAFFDSTNQELRTYRFNGSTWSRVGSVLAVTGGGNPAITALSSTDVAFIDSTNDELRTYRFSGGAWSLVGSGLSIPSSFVTGLSALTSTDVALFDMTSDELRTYRFNGSTWSLVGSGLSIAGAADAHLTSLTSTDIAFFDDANQELRTYRFNGSTWSLVGSGLSVAGVDGPAIAALNGTDVALVDGVNDQLRTYRFNGSTWGRIGSGLPISGLSAVSITAMNGSDVALVDSGSDELRTYRFSFYIGTGPYRPSTDGPDDSFSPLDLSPVSWVRSTVSTLYQDTAGTVPVTGAGQDVGLRVDQSGNGNDWMQVTAAARPTYDGTALVYDSSNDALVMTVPSGGLAGTFVQATTEGVIVGTYSSAAGAYQMPVIPPHPWSVQNDVGQLYFDRELTSPEIANLVQWLKANEGAGSGVYDDSHGIDFRGRIDITSLDGSTLDFSAVTLFSGTWLGCIGLTTFPLLDVSNGTDFSGTWSGCTGLTAFPALDVSSGTNFDSAWFDCSSLTTFPTLDVSSGINFQSAWAYCAGLTSFPLLDVSSGTVFSGAWSDCTGLTSFPALDLSSGTDFQEAWFNCTSLANFPPSMFDGCTATNFDNAFGDTALTQTSIDNILVSINSNGTSNGIFGQYGGSAPSATGEAAIDAMRLRGWTVNVAGGY